MKVALVSRAPGGADPHRLLPPSFKGRGAGGVRFFLPLILLAALACSFLSPAGPGPTIAPTASLPVTPTGGLPVTPTASLPITPTASLPITPTAGPAPAYLGLFDCYGAENGMEAYAGRLNVQPGGAVTFKDYDNAEHAGAWTYDPAAHTFAFTGDTGLASAVYQPAADLLIATLLTNATVVHSEGGSMSCMRAKPGITGPP